MDGMSESRPDDLLLSFSPSYTFDLDGNPIYGPAVSALQRDIDARRVDRTELPNPAGGPPAIISTVFTVMDYNFGLGPRQLWETRVMSGPMARMQTRYTSREDAVKGHAAIVALVRAALDGDEFACRVATAFERAEADDDDDLAGS